MHRKIRFKFGERVNAISLSGKPILGEYRGVRGSYGVYVYGVEVGLVAPASLHICTSLSLTRPPEIKSKPTGKFSRLDLKPGDLCTGYTPKGQAVTGEYMNAEGKLTWIRQPLLKTAHKVLTNTLIKL